MEQLLTAMTLAAKKHLNQGSKNTAQARDITHAIEVTDDHSLPKHESKRKRQYFPWDNEIAHRLGLRDGNPSLRTLTLANIL